VLKKKGHLILKGRGTYTTRAGGGGFGGGGGGGRRPVSVRKEEGEKANEWKEKKEDLSRFNKL